MFAKLMRFVRGSRAPRRRASAPERARRRHEVLEQRQLLASGGAPTAAAAAMPSPSAAAMAAPSPPSDQIQAEQQFIAKVYQDFLQRAPDPAGQTYWLQFLSQQGAATSPVVAQEQMVDAVMASPEYRQDVVTNIYQDFLHRAPDAAGLQYWTDQLGAVGESAVLTDVLASREYEASKGGTTSGLVDGLFTDLLGRAPDPSGQAYWINQFGSVASGAGAANLGLYNNAVAARVQQLLETNEGRLLLLNDAGGDSALSKLTGQGFNQLFFQGNLDHLAQNAFFANYQANPSFEMALQQLLMRGGFYQGGAASGNGAPAVAANPTVPPGVGPVPPAGYPLPA